VALAHEQSVKPTGAPLKHEVPWATQRPASDGPEQYTQGCVAPLHWEQSATVLVLH